MSTTEIKSSCIRIGWKLISVGPETILIEIHQKNYLQDLVCNRSKPLDWSQSLISWSSETLENSMSAKKSFHTQWTPKIIVYKTSEVVLIQFSFMGPPRDTPWQHMNMFTRGLLTWFDRFRRASSVSDCPWPSTTVGHNVCDWDRTLTCRNRLKLDPCGSRNGFDWNLWKFLRLKNLFLKSV